MWKISGIKRVVKYLGSYCFMNALQPLSDTITSKINVFDIVCDQQW